jgi:hypothetical protein
MFYVSYRLVTYLLTLPPRIKLLSEDHLSASQSQDGEPSKVFRLRHTRVLRTNCGQLQEGLWAQKLLAASCLSFSGRRATGDAVFVRMNYAALLGDGPHGDCCLYPRTVSANIYRTLN